MHRGKLAAIMAIASLLSSRIGSMHWHGLVFRMAKTIYFKHSPLICQALVNDIHTVQPSLNGINEVGLALKREAETPFAIKIQKMLDELNAQWELICKQVINGPLRLTVHYTN